MSIFSVAELLKGINIGAQGAESGQFEGQGPGLFNVPGQMSPETLEMPKVPKQQWTPGDVSGFANYGMQAPQLPNFQQQASSYGSVAPSDSSMAPAPYAQLPGERAPSLSGVYNILNQRMTPRDKLAQPMGQVQGIMSMMGDPYANQKEDPFMQQQPGSLMSYLQMLARG